MLDLSIVLPTCNRAAMLERAIAAIEATTRVSHEIIVVDGASSDKTQQVLADAQKKLGDKLRIIREPRREGFVKAANKGFRAARGKNMIWLNDDARPLHGALDKAIELLDEQPTTVAFAALFHKWNSPMNIAYEAVYNNTAYRLCHVRGTLYANFPMGRRETYERLGYFDERYFVCAADPDLSLKAWYTGMSIIPAWGSFIDHDEVEDMRRSVDAQRAYHDNDKLFRKWDLPEKNPYRNDFDPDHPCTVKRLREMFEHEAAA
jgi:GT2 family glycosyltransferase